MYLLVEMADVNLLGVHRAGDTLEQANELFEKFQDKEHLQEADADDLTKECAGTLRLAGDDAYSVQLLEVS